MSTVINQNNVRVAATPPSYYIPSANGVALPAAVRSYVLSVDTTGLPSGADLFDLAIEVQVSGVWQQDVAVAGSKTGPYSNGSNVWTLSTNLIPTATRVRIRMDSCPGYTFPNVQIVTA